MKFAPSFPARALDDTLPPLPMQHVIAHELLTPLAAQKIILHLFMRRLAEEDQRANQQLVEQALHLTERMERLAHDLYDVAALELDRLPLHISSAISLR